MATPKKTKPYAIYYNDGSYMIYDLTQEDFDMLSTCIQDSPTSAIELSIGIIVLKDVRSVIRQKPPEKPKKNEGTAPDLTAEEIEWMAVNKATWRDSNYE
jgi:hypothetical protein